MKEIRLKLLKYLKFNLLFIIIYNIFFSYYLYSKNTYDFAVNLFNEGDYYRAISEFNRFIFYYPDKKNLIQESYIYIIKSYYYGEQFNSAVLKAQSFMNKLNSEYYKNRAKFWLATSLLRLENFTRSRKLYFELTTANTPAQMSEYANYRIIWTYLLSQNWKTAFDYIIKFVSNTQNNELKRKALLLKSEVVKGLNFTPLSPTFAAFLSAIIPGAGQIYTKRIGDGIVAFLLVGALSYGSYYYYKNGPDGMFYGISFFNLLFYLGNIYTAFGSAYKYNINFSIKLKQDIFDTYYEDYNFE